MTSVLPTDLPPWGGLRTERGHLPLVAMDVRADVAGLFATTHVRQSFANTFDDAIEATYIFPLPDRAGVTRFVATLGGRRVEGVLRERQAARDEYDEAIAAGKRAAILEEDRPGVFTARVGNLGPDETADIELELTGPLPYDDGEATFRFPLVVAPRYVPGTPLEGQSVGGGTALDTDLVPDASRVSPPVLLPGQPSPVRLSLEVGVDPLGLQLSDLRSTLHAAIVEQSPVRVALRPGERLDRDFVLRFRLAGDHATPAAVIVPDEGGDGDGTYAVTVIPPAASGKRARRPLDVAVVLDRSGSMAGWKMVAARRAAARIVDALTTDDRLVVVGFDDRIERPDRLAHDLVPATDHNRFAAVEFLTGLEARGGTDIHRAVEEAAALLGGDAADRDRVLVLVTDGQVSQEDLVLDRLGPYLRTGRVFTVGVDRAVNAGFLQRLAEAGRGRSELVESEDALDEAMTRIHRAVTPPLVESVEVGVEGADVVAGTASPVRPPDLHAGAPCVLSGRFRGHPERITVSGRFTDGTPWSMVVVPRTVANRAVCTSWARAHVRHLEDRYAVDGSEALAAEIVDASLTHGVLSRFTAFVAVDPADPTGSTAPRPVVQPVESPSMWPVAKLAMHPTGAVGAAPGLAAAPPAPATPAVLAQRPSPASRLRQLLERLDRLVATPSPGDAARHQLANDLDAITRELADSKLHRAVADLAAAVRSWLDVATKLADVRRILGPDRAREPFWI